MVATTGCGHPKPAHATQKPTSAGGGADRICALFQCKPSHRLRGTTFNGPARNLETLQGGPANRRRWGGGTTKHHTKQAHKRSFPCDTQRPDSVVKHRLGCTVGHDPQADVRSDPGTPRMFSGAGVAVDDGPIEAAAQRHLQRGPRRTMRLKGPSSLTTKPSLASDGGGAFFSNLCFTIHSHFGGWLMRPNDTGTQRSLSTLGGNTANDRATSEDETTCRTP